MVGLAISSARQIGDRKQTARQRIRLTIVETPDARCHTPVCRLPFGVAQAHHRSQLSTECLVALGRLDASLRGAGAGQDLAGVDAARVIVWTRGPHREPVPFLIAYEIERVGLRPTFDALSGLTEQLANQAAEPSPN